VCVCVCVYTLALEVTTFHEHMLYTIVPQIVFSPESRSRHKGLVKI